MGQHVHWQYVILQKMLNRSKLLWEWLVLTNELDRPNIKIVSKILLSKIADMQSKNHIPRIARKNTLACLQKYSN